MRDDQKPSDAMDDEETGLELFPEVDDGEPEIVEIDGQRVDGDGTVLDVEPDHEDGISVAAPQDDVSRLQAELDEVREMYLRKLAEFDNFRKRTEREREELQRTAAENLVKDLIPVLDNFERALQHSSETDPASFHQGVDMIARQLWDVLRRQGLKSMAPIGEPFRPELHEAVQRVEDPDATPGVVAAVLAKGYELSGKLLRPAMVAVTVDATPQDGAGGQQEMDADEGEGP